jgi:hypothetical protein
MHNLTIKYHGQTLTLSHDDALALEAALIQARKSPDQEVQQMTNSGIILVSSTGANGGKFSQPIRPTDCILAPTAKPIYSQSQAVETDC